VIIKDEMLKRTPKGLPSMLDYAIHAENKSMYNTPPCFAIYILGLVCQWLLQHGGLESMEKTNQEKAKILYDAIDATEYYKGVSHPDSRSLMNVTFRLATEDLEKQFVKESTAAGLDGLKGHRSAGGIRASIYNAFPIDGVKALVEFMQEFERKNG